jgi:hypothetical protein
MFARVRLLPSTRAVLAVVRCPLADRPGVEARAAVLADTYRAALGDGYRSELTWDGDIGVWQFAEDPAADELLVWGRVVGADPEEIVRRPETATAALGVWVVAARRPDGVRLVSSVDFVHTLVRAREGARDVVATRGLAALVLAGGEPRVRREAIAEQVLHDYVFGPDELLAGTEVLEEAAVVDVTAAGTAIGSWSPRDTRLGDVAHGAGPAELREIAGACAAALAGHPAAWLGLTAGRDSALVAAAAVDAGARPRTFTLGTAGMPDTVGAAAVAGRLGLEHAVVDVEPGDRGDFSLLVRWAPWQEGMENPRTLLVGPLAWERRDVLWVSGHGGEIARGFYWDYVPAGTDPGAGLAGARGHMDAGAHDEMIRRLRATVAAVEPFAGSPREVLDLVYVVGRMFKWQGRVLPYPQLAAIAPVFLGPRALAVMRGLPQDDRQAGRAFDAALALGSGDPRPPAPPAGGGPGRASLPARVLRRIRGTPPAIDWPLLLAARRGHDPHAGVVAATLGTPWIDHLMEIARTNPWAQRLLWNVLAIDAFDRALEDLRGRLPRA